VKAKVLSVDNRDLRQNLIVYTGTQDVQVQLMEGPHEGMEARVVNPLAGKLEFDEIYAPEDHILVELKDFASVPLPFAFTTGKMYMIWHQSYQHDEQHKWLRKEMIEVANSLPV
jgi:hypothetical protein